MTCSILITYTYIHAYTHTHTHADTGHMQTHAYTYKPTCQQTLCLQKLRLAQGKFSSSKAMQLYNGQAAKFAAERAAKKTAAAHKATRKEDPPRAPDAVEKDLQTVRYHANTYIKH